CLAYIEKIGSYFIDNASHANQFSVLQTYARYLLFLGRDKEALNVLLDCQKYLDTDKRDLSLSDYYKNLSEAYKKNGDYKNALEASDKMHELKESAVNDSTMNVVAKFQADQEVKIHKAEARAKQSRLRVIIMSLIVVLILVFFLVFYIVKMLNIKRKANDELTSKNQILDKQNSEILSQRDKIEDVNRKLYSSINYAQRIQSAAIAQQSEVDALFPYNFVYYKPRDIVSGDFYYVARCGKYNVLVTADCTGHGIPGAFLSMLGISALKEFCVTEEDAENPGKILDRMRLFIKSTLVSDTNRIIDDGMDMTICAFDFENMQLRYAAANQYAIIVRRGDAIKLKGDRMPVGRYIHEKEHFDSASYSLQYGDVVYTFSDGIQDQPGGADDNPLGKKFLVKNLIDFLTEHYTEPLANQCKLIDERITEWRNGRPQVDDITLIGVRV
ncbi:MAG: SpoIIE family protein phosphatase, partial [Bacteroidales bacterium]|nr:SpoIIE family protein phosphatase [Bacteroidales bacterium]